MMRIFLPKITPKPSILYQTNFSELISNAYLLFRFYSSAGICFAVVVFNENDMDINTKYMLNLNEKHVNTEQQTNNTMNITNK